MRVLFFSLLLFLPGLARAQSGGSLVIWIDEEGRNRFVGQSPAIYATWSLVGDGNPSSSGYYQLVTYSGSTRQVYVDPSGNVPSSSDAYIVGFSGWDLHFAGESSSLGGISGYYDPHGDYHAVNSYYRVTITSSIDHNGPITYVPVEDVVLTMTPVGTPPPLPSPSPSPSASPSPSPSVTPDPTPFDTGGGSGGGGGGDNGGGGGGTPGPGGSPTPGPSGTPAPSATPGGSPGGTGSAFPDAYDPASPPPGEYGDNQGEGTAGHVTAISEMAGQGQGLFDRVKGFSAKFDGKAPLIQSPASTKLYSYHFSFGAIGSFTADWSFASVTIEAIRGISAFFILVFFYVRTYARVSKGFRNIG